MSHSDSLSDWLKMQTLEWRNILHVSLKAYWNSYWNSKLGSISFEPDQSLGSKYDCSILEPMSNIFENCSKFSTEIWEQESTSFTVVIL